MPQSRIEPPGRFGAGVVCCVGLAAWLGAGATMAEEDKDYELDSFYDRLSSSYHPIAQDVWVMGRLEFDFEAEIDPDLGTAPDDQDEIEVEPKAIAALAWQPSDRFRIVTRVELSQDLVIEPEDRDTPNPDLALTRAYAVVENVVPDTIIVAGRQNFVDERKWLWEEPLDGVRAIWRNGAFGLDFAAARDGLAQQDLLERDDTKGGNYFWGSARLAVNDEVEGAAYALFVDNREDRDDDLLFLGVRSEGEIIDDVEHWLEAAVVTGEENDRDVLGFGFDVGATLETDMPLEPSFTVAVAFGSGDDGDGRDTAFRQTGLQENSEKFAGEASFDYYGQVLDPELSNLLILTAGAGIRPTEDSSIDLVYHHYRQARKSANLRDAALEVDPNGESAYLGDGLDLVLGWDATDRLSLEAVGGVFFPGSAFDSNDPAYHVGAEIEFRF